MSIYLYAKWKNSPSGAPVEFYSELDAQRYETRKVEIFKDGSSHMASKTQTTGNTRLGITPVPSNAEIMSQGEFEVKSISKADFEAVWVKQVKK